MANEPKAPQAVRCVQRTVLDLGFLLVRDTRLTQILYQPNLKIGMVSVRGELVEP